MGRSVLGVGNRFGFQNNLAKNMKRSSTISTFQPKFGRSTIGTRASNTLGARNKDDDHTNRNTLEYKKQIAAKYNNLMRQSKSSVGTQKRIKQNTILSNSPVAKFKNISKRGESINSTKNQIQLNKDWSASNINLSSKRKVSIKAQLQMLKDDDLLPD